MAKQRLSKIPTDYGSLIRQFSPDAINQMKGSGQKLATLLRLGGQVKDATVVLSDIQNFSTLAKITDSNKLTSLISEYCQDAKGLAYQHDGTWGKWTGDGVLAVFGYPFLSAQHAWNAFRFCLGLVPLTNELLETLILDINENIETGVRVGVTTGDIGILDVSAEVVEVDFSGDIVNLAARLQANCLINGILMDNRTMAKLHRSDRTLAMALRFEGRILSSDKMKGQPHPIRAWQLPPLF